VNDVLNVNLVNDVLNVVKYRLKRKGVRVERIAERVAEILDIDVAQLWAGGKQPQVVRARSLFCYWATNELGVSQVWLSRKLGLSQPAISLSVARGRQIVSQKNYEIGNL
jgi:chromosomal replication initiation ATPase DnaA